MSQEQKEENHDDIGEYIQHSNACRIIPDNGAVIMKKTTDIKGQVFGTWEITDAVPGKKYTRGQWVVRCTKCGMQTIVAQHRLGKLTELECMGCTAPADENRTL